VYEEKRPGVQIVAAEGKGNKEKTAGGKDAPLKSQRGQISQT
jgi:hypothetical protein